MVLPQAKDLSVVLESGEAGGHQEIFLSAILMSKSAMPTGLGVTLESDRPAGYSGTCLRSGSVTPWLGPRPLSTEGMASLSEGMACLGLPCLESLAFLTGSRCSLRVPREWSVGTQSLLGTVIET